MKTLNMGAKNNCCDNLLGLSPDLFHRSKKLRNSKTINEMKIDLPNLHQTAPNMNQTGSGQKL